VCVCVCVCVLSAMEGSEVTRLGGNAGGGAAHLATVHCLKWTWDDKCLASASADGTAKVRACVCVRVCVCVCVCV